jgi:putative endonuclease
MPYNRKKGGGVIRARSHNRKRSQRWGIVAEYLCAALLVLKGYSVLALRHRNRYGEIDIIAVRAGVIAFVEVKARADKDAAFGSVTSTKQQRLQEAASAFIAARKKYAQHGLRFDVMVVTSPWKITHLKDAWRL